MEIQYLRIPAAFATVFCFFLARCFFLSLGPLFNSCIANVNPALPEIQKNHENLMLNNTYRSCFIIVGLLLPTVHLLNQKLEK